jgi:hypothetical protein
LIGAISGSILGLILQWLGLTDRTFHDLAQVFILAKVYPNALGYLIGTLAHFGVAGLNGAIFAHFVMATSKKYLVLKGMFIGVTMWLFFVGFGNFFRMPQFSNMPPLSALTIYICSATYGLTMSFTLRKLIKL